MNFEVKWKFYRCSSGSIQCVVYQDLLLIEPEPMMKNLCFISLWLWGMCLWSALSLCVSGQTPGGDVEAAGQSGGSHSRRSSSSIRDGCLAWGRWRVGGKFKGQQSPARATPSLGGKVDCMVHFFPRFHTHPSFAPSLKCQIDILKVQHVLFN